MQWLITDEDNEKIGNLFKGAVPFLKEDEAWLEDTFTLETFQKKGIWAWATERIARIAREQGKKHLIVFIRQNNIVSLNACLNLGFVPYKSRMDRWFMFTRRYRFNDGHCLADQNLINEKYRSTVLENSRFVRSFTK